MAPLKDDEEEVKEETGIIILPPNKLLYGFPVLPTQRKAKNNSCKMKYEIKLEIIHQGIYFISAISTIW